MPNFRSPLLEVCPYKSYLPSLMIINSRTAIAGAIIGLLLLQFKEFELYWGAVFFLRCVHTFFNDFDLSKRDKQVNPSGH